MARSGIAGVPATFSPIIREWFERAYGKPTPIQAAAWPRILDGEHLLVTAPTGSGKTLTAFLAAINAFATGDCPTGRTSVLYVSPLKALNNDIRRNLLVPLAELRHLAAERHAAFPEISVATRSGDTPARDRRRMLRRPPEILITTPESLNLILSSPRARAMLATVRTLILDEIHAVVGTKRGTHLITAVERLVLLAGEVQRIAVSATVKPLDLVARFVGGFEIVDRVPGSAGRSTGETTYRPRAVRVVEAPDTKVIEITVDFPDMDEELERGETEGLWPHLVRELRRIIDRNTSTLIFVATRRHAEKLTLLLNDNRENPIAYSHHGSLSRELRHFVEQSLKEGRLRAIVATSSLELGIDIGALDEIVLVKTPATVSSTLQRVGRAGHRVGETSRGTIFPLYGRDMVDAAAMAGVALERDIEEIRPVDAPLDVLAQVIVSMTAMETWNLDDLFDAIRACYPYRELERRLFDLVMEMLAGRYAETRIRELRPRVSIDRVTGDVSAREGATTLLYHSGGTIPDRGYYAIRLAGGGPVGELDEEFVWERRVGETFVFGSQAWTIQAITDRDVVVVQAPPGTQAVPFWRADSRGRDIHYAERLLDFLLACEQAILRGELDAYLASLPHLTPRMRSSLAEVLERQRDATGTPLPHRHHIVVESVRKGPRSRADEETQELIIHTGWGGRVNEPFAIALSALWEQEHGVPLEAYGDNDCIVVLLPQDFRPAEAFSPAQCRKLLRPGRIEALLREHLERTGRFGALFRENAGRALLLPKGGFSRRMPLWLTRLRSKKLLASTTRLPDFPILIETWRNCLSDEFDLPGLRNVLQEVAAGETEVSVCETLLPSPFAAEVVWHQINQHMYEDDSRPGSVRSSLSDDLVRSAVLTDALRPTIAPAIVEQVEERLMRLAPGYAPDGAGELLDWVTERVALPAAELRRLEAAVSRDHGPEAWTIGGAVDRYVWIRSEECWLFASVNRLPSIASLYPEAALFVPAADSWSTPPRADRPAEGAYRPVALAGAPQGDDMLRPSPEEVLLEMMRFYGPMRLDDAPGRFGLRPAVWQAYVASLQDEALIATGQLTEGSEDVEVCEVETLEYLLRIRRARARPEFRPVDATALVPWWSEATMLASGRSDPDALVDVLDVLFGYPAPTASWESDLLPARLDQYHPVWLDGLFAEHELVWLGCGPQKICFCPAEEVDLFRPDPTPDAPVDAEADAPAAEEDESDAGDPDDPWRRAWMGEASTRSFQTVRAGIVSRFAPTGGERERSDRVPDRPRWRSRRPGLQPARLQPRRRADDWFTLDPPSERDPLMRHEEDRERARVLLRRYGVVFRELVQREGGAFRWTAIFRALRLMELAGECVSGVFVKGVSTPQFARRSALEGLNAAAASTRIVWMSAADPASPCGLSLKESYGELPARTAASHLVFRGTRLVLTSRRNGRELTISVGENDPDIDRLFEPLRHLVSRRWNPLPRVVIETVNGIPTRNSPFATALRAAGCRDEHTRFVLEAPYR